MASPQCHGSCAVIEARNVGKPIRDARGEVALVAAVLEYWGGAANKISGETIPVQDAGLEITLREPVGVCALITPWNFPLVIASWKIAPALACGNTVVVKPAQLTPLSVLMLADILMEAGLPSGVISVLPGPGSAIGNALVTHPLVSKVSFTGSTEVGSQIMRLCANNITRVSLELGGKAANVVFADTDLERCIEASAFAVFGNCGQDCCARSRILVQRPIYEEFVERFARRTAALQLGQPLDEKTEIGPLISAGQRQRCQLYSLVSITSRELPRKRSSGLLSASFHSIARRKQSGKPMTCHMAYQDRCGLVILAGPSA